MYIKEGNSVLEDNAVFIDGVAVGGAEALAKAARRKDVGGREEVIIQEVK